MRHLRRRRRTRGIRRVSGFCPASVRWLSESRSATLAANYKPGARWNTTKTKVDEMVLALLSLTMFEEDQDGARAWKGYDWVAMDRLHAKGYVSDPKSKAKSVVVTVKGVQRSRELFEKHFGKKEPDARQR